MISFESDYNNGAHPKVLQRLIDTNDEQTLSYGFDRFSDEAKEKIKAACGDPDAEVFFLVGGTQTNATVIDSLLHCYEGVVAVDSAHINMHEAGAIEATGHKQMNIRGKDGKMQAEVLQQFMEEFLGDGNAMHSVYPKLAYITFPTELGTLYSAEELSALYDVCQRYNMILYIDGARMGYGLQAEGCDMDLKFIADHCDAFYIGGTKVGALCGEAVVFTHANANKHFFTIIKQHGALAAKGRLLGVQFDALFTNNLYFDISRHAIDMAMKMKQLFKRKGYDFYIDSPTNQQFVIVSDEEAARLDSLVRSTLWAKLPDNRRILRFVTSWATREEDLKELERALQL